MLQPLTPARATILLISALAMGWYHLHRPTPTSAERSPAETPRAPLLTPKVAPPTIKEKPSEVKPKDTSSLPTDSREFAHQLEQIRDCYQTDSCAYPQTDPRSYHFAVGRHLAATLNEFSHWAQSENIKENLIAETAREYLANSDGLVQEAALRLMATQDPSPENLQAIIDQVLGGHDAELVDLALAELQRYTSNADRDKISAALAEALVTGAPFLARRVSERIAPFLNSRNSAYFAQIARELPPESIYRINLESSLKNL